MASEVLVKKSMALRFEVGVDEKGQPISKRFLFSNIDIEVDPQNLVNAAQAIADISQGSLLDVTTVDTNILG